MKSATCFIKDGGQPKPRMLASLLREGTIAIARAACETLRLRYLGVQICDVDVLRLTLASGIFVELTKVAPNSSRTYGELDGEVLVRVLRRRLGSAIDLLLEYGQHSYQEFLHHQQQGERALPVQPFPSSWEP
jgi:hypothetical protein